MKDRIQEYMDHKNINAGELANLLEVQRSNISHILNGRNKPSAAFIEKMLTVFKDLNARWLLTGEGTMLGSDKQTIEIAQVSKEPDKEDTIKIQNPSVNVQSTVKESELKESSVVRIQDDAIDKIVFFYKDGSYSSFTDRSNK